MKRRWWRSNLPPPEEKQFSANDGPCHESCQQDLLELIKYSRKCVLGLKKTEGENGQSKREESGAMCRAKTRYAAAAAAAAVAAAAVAAAATARMLAGKKT